MAFALNNFLPNAIKNYHRYSRSHFFGLIAVLVLLIIYEASSAMLYYEAAGLIKKNSAEVMIKRVFWFFGFRYGMLNWLVYAAVLGWAYWRARQQQMLAIQPAYYPYTVFESLTYALALGSMVNLMSRGFIINVKFLGQVAGEAGLAAKMALALGAGIYEELLFRFFILSVLLALFQRTLVNTKTIARQTLALTISAALFSAYHFLDMGAREALTATAFFFRFYAGIVLGILFLWRGLGVAAYTHAFYDLFLIFQSS